MKTPRELAEMIAGHTEQQIGRFEIAREAEIVANECSEMLAEIYVDEARKIVYDFATTDLEMMMLPRYFDDKNEPMADILDLLCDFPEIAPWKRDALAEIIENWYTFAKTLSATMERKHRGRKLAAGEEQTEAGNDLGLIGKADTQRARKYFGRAMERGWIEKTENGPRWVCKETKASRVSFAYLVGRIYTDVVLPNDDIGRTFDIFNISDDKDHLNRRKNRQDWQDMIDEIFID